MRNTLFLLFSLVIVSCTTEINHRGKTPIAIADDAFLYMEDLQMVIPPGMTGTDSIRFAEYYIRKWAEDIVFYNKAKSNISNEKEIEQLVENYRRTLILNEYQERLVREKLEASISDEEIKKYYEQDKSLFILSSPMLKGVYVKVALNNRELKNVRRYMAFRNENDRDKLEGFTLRGAADYSYFLESWTDLSDISQKLPKSVDASSIRENNHMYEFHDSLFVHMLYVDSVISKGDYLPYELAYRDIWEVIYNEKKVQFIKEVRKDLYDKALEEKKIRIIR